VGNKRKDSEKAKKRSLTFCETCEVEFLGNSVTKYFFRAECLKVRTGTYFVTRKALTNTIT